MEQWIGEFCADEQIIGAGRREAAEGLRTSTPPLRAGRHAEPQGTEPTERVAERRRSGSPGPIERFAWWECKTG